MKIFFVLSLLSLHFFSCAGGAPVRNSITPAQGPAVEFSAVEGKNWMLTEIIREGQVVNIDRNELNSIGMGGAFTINFQDDRVSGMGAPNRFFGPFTSSSGNVLNIGNLASTLMAAIFEPEALKEHEFFAYLSGVSRWDLREEALELYTSDNNGTVVILVFDEN